MSHFFALVITNAQNGHAERSVETLLAPFNENITVPEYDRTCHCIGETAKERADKLMQAELGTWDEAKDKFKAEYPLPPNASWEERIKLEPLWRRLYMKPRYSRRDELLAGMDDKQAPTPDCDQCHGQGTYRSTYNPDSQWDWYSIGGRWNDVVGGNQAPVAWFLDNDQFPFAIVTPDGKWHQKGNMRWFGMVSDEKDNWPEEARRIMNEHQSLTGIVCDLHI